MNKALLLLATGLGLAACQKDQDVGPADVQADFDTTFALNQSQQAFLPQTSAAELTVKVEELQYSICPKDIVCCFVPNFVNPTLLITDAQGETQRLRMPKNANRPWHPDWQDTATVRANNRKYLVTYVRWAVSDKLAEREQVQSKHLIVSLKVSKVIKQSK